MSAKNSKSTKNVKSAKSNVKHAEPKPGTVKALIAKCEARGTVRPTAKVDLKKCVDLNAASKMIKVNTGRIGWMTRAAGGNRLVAVKVGNKLFITIESLKQYAKARDAYYANRKH